MSETAARVTGLVLAGGLAERMGACKALLPLNGVSALETIVSRMRGAGVADVIVVTGGYDEIITAEANRLGCRVKHNPEFKTGMFSSVLAGVRALSPDMDAFFLLPVDTPLVKTATYRTLLDAFYEAYGNPDVVYPTFRGERGHPPLIGRTLIAPILDWHGAGGLRGLFEAHPNRGAEAPTGDRSTLLDMDTPEDYAALEAYAAREFYPDDEECAELTEIARTPERVVGHMRMVARVAGMLALELEESGFFLNKKLLRASCLLHDIAKGRANHEAEGARALRLRGYVEVADAVGAHRDLPVCDALAEAEILYLADRVTDGETVVSIASRVRKMEERFAPGTDARRAAHRRLEQASEIQLAVERATGKTLEKMLDPSRLYRVRGDFRSIMFP